MKRSRGPVLPGWDFISCIGVLEPPYLQVDYRGYQEATETADEI